MDADGVLQEGSHLGQLLPEASVSIPIAELEEPFLTSPGFAAEVEKWSASNGVGEFAKLIASRHCAVKVDAGIIEEVGRWRRRFDGVILATNQVEERLASMMGSYSRDFFDVVVASCNVGYAKPDPSYFAALCHAVQSPPSSVAFIDDRARNVLAAAESGLVARRFPRMAGRLEMRRLIESIMA
nr:HAD-IA family hydrolase [Kribbella solani]